MMEQQRGAKMEMKLKIRTRGYDVDFSDFVRGSSLTKYWVP
jgi:hypothetical protein